jgi:hypothetical protein
MNSEYINQYGLIDELVFEDEVFEFYFFDEKSEIAFLFISLMISLSIGFSISF